DGSWALCVATDSEGRYLPTRWNGSRTIDYGFVKGRLRCSGASLQPEVYGDHIQLKCVLQGGHSSRLEQRRLRPLRQGDDAVPPTSAEDVERQWESFNRGLEQAFSGALQHLTRRHRRGSGHRSKGTLGQAVNEQEHGRLFQNTSSFKERKLAKLLGRIRETMRSTTRRADRERLDGAIRRTWPGDTPRPATRAQQEEVIARLLDSTRTQDRRDRVRDWRERMKQGGKPAHQWIKQGDITFPTGLFRRNEVAHTAEDNVQLVAAHWQQTNRADVTAEEVFDQWRRPLGPAREPCAWTSFTASEIQAALKRGGAAAGITGWTAEEVQRIPHAAVEDFTALLNGWLGFGRVPQAWQELRMVVLPKPGKEVRQDGTMDVAHLRPISIACIFWRAVPAAFLQRQDTQAWIRSWVPPECHGALKGRSTFTALSELDRAINGAQQTVATLDLQTAFDNLFPAAAVRMLSFLGLPRVFGRILSQVWENQRRWLIWGRHCSMHSYAAGLSMPQRDAMAPLAMIATLAPVQDVRRCIPRLRQVLFVDDRTLHGPSALIVTQGIQCWASWSQRMGWRENFDKLHILTRTQAQRQDYAATDYAEYVKEQVRILGVDFTSHRTAKARATLAERRETAMNRGKRISCMPVARELRVRFWRALAGSTSLISILEGNHSDLNFKAGQDAYAALRRQGARLRWQMDPQGVHLHRELHVLRESWRAHSFREFLESNRRDATGLASQGAAYHEARTEQARRAYGNGNSHERAVLIGAALSDAFYWENPAGATCRWCATGAVPSWSRGNVWRGNVMASLRADPAEWMGHGGTPPHEPDQGSTSATVRGVYGRAPLRGTRQSKFQVQWAFCTAGATIVSGGVAERVKSPTYAVYAFCMTSFIYAVVVAWTWGYGWLDSGGRW
ncbi:amtB, partial [Symbiodinium sp. CCMP2456]